MIIGIDHGNGTNGIAVTISYASGRTVTLRAGRRATAAIEAAYAEWVNYYVKTEAFDRALPGRWSELEPASWIPSEPAESWRYARNVLRLVSVEARRDLVARNAALRATAHTHTRDASVADVLAALLGADHG